MIEKFGIKKYKYIVALTIQIKNKIRTINPQATIKIIPPAIDSNQFKNKSNEKDFVLYMGRIDMYQKGLDVLIEAWKEIEKINKKTKLYIAGSGTKNDTKALEQLIAASKLSESIKLIGKVSGKDKNYYLSSCKFFIAPSRFETFGISVLEALAAGKAVLCTDIEGFEWISNTCSFKVNSNNISKLAQGIEYLLTNTDKRENMQKHARVFAKRYSLKSVVSHYEKFINYVLQSDINKKMQLKRPSEFIILLDGVIKAFIHNKYEKKQLPTKIGRYIYDTPISKKYKHHDYLTGIYRYKAKKVFIKIWNGRRTSMQYQFLRNELRVSQLLYTKLHASDYTIRVPQPIEWIETESYAAAVFETIDGKPLSQFSLDIQAQHYKKILSELRTVSFRLKPLEKVQFIQRENIFYYLSILYFISVAILKSPYLIRNILSVGVTSIVHLIKIKKDVLVLNHRDLSIENILLHNDNIYLLDTEHMALTYEGYDYSMALLYSNLQLPLKRHIPVESTHNVLFFGHYLVIQKFIKKYLEKPVKIRASFS